MNKRIYFLILASAISILLAACTHAAQETSTSVKLNQSVSQETSQSTTLDKQDEITALVSNIEQENKSEVENSSIHLEQPDDLIFSSWEADIIDEQDKTYIYDSLTNMEPSDNYDPMLGGYSICITINKNGVISKYCVTNTCFDRDQKRTVLAYDFAILEDPANIQNYDPETKYYKWYDVNSNIWNVLQKYGDCPFEYKDGEFIDDVKNISTDTQEYNSSSLTSDMNQQKILTKAASGLNDGDTKNCLNSTKYFIPDDVIEFANYYVETSVRADPRAYGLSTRFGKSYISPKIPQYIYENNQIRPYSESSIYLLFYNINAVQFISNTSNYGGDCYAELTEFLKDNDKICIIISGNKYFAKSKDNSFEIDEFTHLLEKDEPEVTPEIINNIESDQIEFMPLKKYFLKEYWPQPPKSRKSTEIELKETSKENKRIPNTDGTYGFPQNDETPNETERLDYNQKQYNFEDYCNTYMDEDAYGGYASEGDVVILYYLDLEKIKAVAKQYVPDWDKSGDKFVKDPVKVKYRQAEYSMTYLKQVKLEVYKELSRQGIEDPFINIYNNQLTISLFEEEIPEMQNFLKTYEHKDCIDLHNASAHLIPCT